MTYRFSPASLIPSPLWLVLALFSISAGAVNPPGSYGGAAIAACCYLSTAIKSDGTVWLWGSELGYIGYLTPQLSGLTHVTAIAATSDGTYALKGDGTIWFQDMGLHAPHQVSNLTNVTAFTAGSYEYHLGMYTEVAVALKGDGTVWAWGNNSKGQLGDGTTTNRTTPVQVSGLNGGIAIAASGDHTVALKGDGTVWAWGKNYDGELGDGTTTNRSTPVQVSGLNGVVALVAGGYHTVTLKSDGTVWAWGNNVGLGDGTTTNRHTPVQVLSRAGIGFLNLFQTTPLPSDSIVLTLEEPDGATTYSGVANVRGWAVAPAGMQQVELYVDGQSFGAVPLGGKRTDVGNAYPTYPNSAQSGFAMAFNYSELTAGQHTFAVQAIDTVGGRRYSGHFVNVARFQNPFMADPVAVNLDQATLTWGGNAFAVQNLRAAGQSYNVRLDWRPAAQGFALTRIDPAGGAPTSVRALQEEPIDSTPLPVAGASAGPSGDTPVPVRPAAAGDGIVLNLEEPANGSNYSGVANVRGWAVAPAGMQQVELYVDGQLASTVPLGGRRADVGAAYPNYPNSAQSGFAMAFNYSELAAGAHTFTVRAIDKTGGGRNASATVQVVRFAQAFMADPAIVNVNTAKLTRSGRTIAIQNLIAAGRSYDVSLDWQPATQGFALTRIADSQGVPTECVYSLLPIDQMISYDSYPGSVNVTTPLGCSWTAQSNDDWITMTSGASGAGPGTVKYSVSSNPSEYDIRTGGLTIAGHLFTIYQWPKPQQPGGGK